jgi:hypothetical protein
MSARIIPFAYDGHTVRFNAEGWINATEAAARFCKLPHEWLRLPETVAYLDAMCKYGKIPQLVRTQRGRNGGTWLHPKLAVAFARWLSVDFAVWCDEQVDALIRGELDTKAIARRQAAIGYRSLCDALSLISEANGRPAKAHVFMNEARLINEVITGLFAGRDRDQLSQTELELVMLVENRDVLLIGQGKDYAARKAELGAYVRQLRTGKKLEKVA